MIGLGAVCSWLIPNKRFTEADEFDTDELHALELVTAADSVVGTAEL